MIIVHNAFAIFEVPFNIEFTQEKKTWTNVNALIQVYLSATKFSQWDELLAAFTANIWITQGSGRADPFSHGFA